MRAIIKPKKAAGLELVERSPPEISDNEVLIRVEKSSICGTDLSIYQWSEWAQHNVPPPVVIGHEFVGHIEAMGKQVRGFKEGQRVCGEGHLTCGRCRNCLRGKRHLCPKTRGIGYHIDGCFADFVKMPQENLFLIPEAISDDIAAIFDPFGNAVHTALSFNLTAEQVLITGAGPIGIMAAAVAKMAGAHRVVITDINNKRLELARKMGIQEAVNVNEIPLESVIKNFSVGLEMSGSLDAFNQMIALAEPGARIALLGVLPAKAAADWHAIIFKMLQLKGIWGREIFSTWFQMTALIERGLDLSPLITHHFPAEEYERAFEAMFSGNCGKVILDWSRISEASGVCNDN